MMRTHGEAGFTLLELIIAASILTLVISLVLRTFLDQQKTFVAQDQILQVQEDARLASDIMVTDIRMAGLLVQREVGLSSTDGGAGAPDSLCVSDASYMADDTVLNASDRFERAAIGTDIGAGETTIEIAAGELDIDLDGNDDFTSSEGIIIVDGTKSHCARITGIASNTLTFAPPTPGGFVATAATGIAVPANIYELSAPNLTRNALLISSQIEDLQVEFAIDVNGDGSIDGTEFPIHSLDGQDLDLVRGVQVSVLGRTARQDPNLTSGGRQAVANRLAAGTPDGFMRRLVQVAVAPRNLQ